MRKRQILIIGNNDNGCTPELEKIAYDAGAEVAKSNSVSTNMCEKANVNKAFSNCLYILGGI